MKEKESGEQASDINNDNRLEAVRDLLFGPNDQQYRQEFKEIKDQITQNRTDLDKSSETLKSDLLDRIEKLEKKVDDDVNSLKSDLSTQIEKLNDGKVDRLQLAKLLQDIAKKLEG